MSDRPDDDVVTFKNERDASPGLFDLRLLIGGLLAVYGVILFAASFFTDTAKSDGIDINLWMGIGMFVSGLLFLLWVRLAPLKVEGESALAKAERGRDA
jgi:cytochrome c biogenesis protein CcdA